MATYVLRDIPAAAWEGARARAQADGWSPQLLFQLLEDYGAGRITPSCGPGYAPGS